ncbi:MAG TPA: ATP-dependent Clp protease proteolytic subunit [Bacillota bacterium]|nr:ATP-dependent Clp protease proteolytic subunit [Bacillota bacterium]
MNEEDQQQREADKTPDGVTTDKDIYALVISGHVEGHYSASPGTKTTKYEQIIPTLVAVEESAQIKGLLVLLNTTGGDVEAGLAISELIATMTKPTVSLVLGGGHSIGIPLAVSAKKSFIVKTATMTLHPMRVNGLVIGVPQTYDYFDKMQDRIIGFITRNSHADEKKLRRMMLRTDELTTDIGTVLCGEEAVESGIIDCVGGLGSALSELRAMCRDNTGKSKEEKQHGSG